MPAETTRQADRTVGQILYFCRACSHRLHPEEVKAALARRESYNTVCCAKCAQEGQCVPDPVAYEEQVFQAHAEMAFAPAPVLTGVQDLAPPAGTQHLGEPPPQGRARASAAAVPSRPPSARAPSPPRGAPEPELLEAETPPEPKHRRWWIAGAIAALLLLGLTGWLVLGRTAHAPRPRPPVHAPRKDHVVAAKAPPTPVAVPSPPPQPPPPPPDSVPPPPPESVPPPPAAATQADLEMLEDQVRMYLKGKNYRRAKGRLDSLTSSIPKDEAHDPWRAKVAELAKQIEDGSRAGLAELLAEAQAKADAGDVSSVERLFKPHNLDELLLAQADEAGRKEGEFRDLARSHSKKVEAKRQREFEDRRREFENGLPASLPEPIAALPAKAKVFFGPESTVPVKAGSAGPRQAPGKVPYLESGCKASFQGDIGMLYFAQVVVDYSASERGEAVISIEAKDAGGQSCTLALPAGKFCRQSIVLTKGVLKGRHGEWTGRSITKLNVEFRNFPPGALAVFRISVGDSRPDK